MHCKKEFTKLPIGKKYHHELIIIQDSFEIYFFKRSFNWVLGASVKGKKVDSFFFIAGWWVKVRDFRKVIS